MEILISTDGIISAKFPKAGVNDIADSGYSEVVLNISKSAFEFKAKRRENLKDNWIFKNPQELGRIIDPIISAGFEKNLKFTAAYVNFTPPHLDINDDRSEILKELNNQSLEIAIKAGCKFIILRPIAAGIGNNDVWKFNHDHYLELAKIAKANGLMILLENQQSNRNDRLRGICSETDEIVEWIDRLNDDAGDNIFGYSMDVGTCSLFGQNMYEISTALGDRLKMIIVRDCDSLNESSMLPFTSVYEGACRTDYFNLIRGLRAINFDGLIAMQFEDTAKSFSPIIRSKLLQLSKSIAEDYLAYQIGIEKLLKKYSTRIIFGAGYTGNNYLSAYGEKYPPLFICDNNKKLWNTELNGVKVESPEKLKTIDEDCLILICNNYYSEIENQIRDMKLKNPIELFNG